MIDILHKNILPAALSLLPTKMDTPAARVMMMAIALQESRVAERVQIGGPARGFYQFEQIGVRGVLGHHASRRHALTSCDLLRYDVDEYHIYQSIADNDVLATCFARLLLWQHPAPLPDLDDPDAAWQYYVDQWRPGKPHRHTWDKLFQQALELIT